MTREDLARALFVAQRPPGSTETAASDAFDIYWQWPHFRQTWETTIDALLDRLYEPDAEMLVAYAARHQMIGHPNRLADPERRRRYDESVRRAATSDWQAMIDVVRRT